MDHSKISPNTYLVSTPEERIQDVYSFLGTYGTPDLPANLGYDFFAHYERELQARLDSKE